MHRTTRPSARAALLGTTITVLLATSCATTVTGIASSSSATPRSADPVAWVNKVCGSLLPFVEASSTRPTVDRSDPQAALKGASTFLGGVETSLDTALTRLKDAGPAPVDGGDEVVTALTDALTPIRTSVHNAKTTVDAADPADPVAAAAALPAAYGSLQGLTDLNTGPSADLQDQPALRQAARQAPNCRILGIGG